MVVMAICWRHLTAQERFQVKTRNTHYMPELTIAVRAGKAYHKATCEHVTDKAVHPVGEVRNSRPAEYAYQRHTQLSQSPSGSLDVSSAQELLLSWQDSGLVRCSVSMACTGQEMVPPCSVMSMVFPSRKYKPSGRILEMI